MLQKAPEPKSTTNIFCFLVESFLDDNNKTKKELRDSDNGFIFEIDTTQNSTVMNPDAKHVKTIFNGKKVVIAYEDPSCPFLKIIDFQKVNK